MNVLLISTYELGRQPFGVASPAAWLKREGHSVTCADLAIERLAAEAVAAADLVAFYVPMHTATRIACRVVERVRTTNPRAHICFYGLYAPLNQAHLRTLGADTLLGGEFEQGLVSLARRLESGGDGRGDSQPEPLIDLGRQRFLRPDRTGLPSLDKYAKLQVGPGKTLVAGSTEASRGCKHLCRHCPIVPVYGGKFRVVQPDVVLDDIRQQVDAGARHVTFGDADFFNGPTHAMAVVEALHEAFPELTYDVTIKVEHLLKHAELLPRLRDTGCLFVTTAVESVDDRILAILEKGHTAADFAQAVTSSRRIGLNLSPTFVPFTPWTSIEGYVELLEALLELDLVDSVSPIQLAIRLLVPGFSRLLELEEVRAVVGPLDQENLVHPWVHADPRVDRLQERLTEVVHEGEHRGASRREIFRDIWALAREVHDAGAEADRLVAALDQAPPAATVPFLTEPWYC